MRLQDNGDSFTIWISARETRDWAAGRLGNGCWPCSGLAGARLRAAFDVNGCFDYAANGHQDWHIDGAEFSALVADFVRARLPKDHPCYFVAVGQFEGSDR